MVYSNVAENDEIVDKYRFNIKIDANQDREEITRSRKRMEQ